MVRILCHNQEDINKDFFRNRILKANDFRRSIGLDDNYRVIFSESDGIPGLIVDKYGDYLSIQIMCLGLENFKQDIIDIFL